MLGRNTWNHLNLSKLFVLRIFFEATVVYKSLLFVTWNHIIVNIICYSIIEYAYFIFCRGTRSTSIGVSSAEE